MTLTWRDGLATLLGVVALTVYMAVTRGWGWAGLTSYKTGAFILGGIGLAMCIAAGKLAVDENGEPSYTGTLDVKDPWIGFMSALGTAALVLTVVGGVTGSTAVFTWLGIDIVALWTLSTLRHMIYGLIDTGHRAHPIH